MKASWSLLLFMFVLLSQIAYARTYVGSTPADGVVRKFLGISLTDSIDFIRWKLDMDAGRFSLQCQYGLSQPSTPGFSNEQRVAFEGEASKLQNWYRLSHKGKTISILEVNTNVLQLLDESKQMLVGNGGYSYALNNT